MYVIFANRLYITLQFYSKIDAYLRINVFPARLYITYNTSVRTKCNSSTVVQLPWR